MSQHGDVSIESDSAKNMKEVFISKTSADQQNSFNEISILTQNRNSKVE